MKIFRSITFFISISNSLCAFPSHSSTPAFLPITLDAKVKSNSDSSVVITEDFETESTSRFYLRLINHPRLALAPGEGVGGGTALRSTYVGGKMGSLRNVVSHHLPRPLIEGTLNFDVKFEKDFQFVYGGKLMGLGPKVNVGPKTSGRPDVWSAKCMFGPKGSIHQYVYHQNMKRPFPGDKMKSFKPFNFKKDQYYSVSYHIKVNDPPEKSNGFFYAYIDGNLICKFDNLQLRKVGGDESAIYSLLFSTFHGGRSSNWAPKNTDGSYATVYSLFDNFTVHEGKHIRKKPVMEK